MIATTVVIVGLMVGGVAAPASAEACSSSGLQPRVLVTDDPGFIETQYCLDGQWRTTSRLQVAPDTKVINEKVWDPRDDRYNLSAAEAFFGIKTRDPYETVASAKALLDAATDTHGLVELKVALADVRAQALLNRQETRRGDGCQTRSTTYSEFETRFLDGWKPPVSIAPAGEPSRIDFAFAPGTSHRTQIAVLNAIDQYESAVSAQDSLGRYPARIVPHDPSSPARPTITFRDEVDDELDNGEEYGGLVVGKASMDYESTPPGEAHRWKTGSIILGEAVTPAVVGHEIGHVLGINHLPVSTTGTMSGTGRSSHSWTPRIPSGSGDSQAFDDCMFLPPVTTITGGM